MSVHASLPLVVCVLPVSLHVSLLTSLPFCLAARIYMCLSAVLSLPEVLWDCHKVLITHMTSPTSCLPCILGLSGLKNPFSRLPPLTAVLLCLLSFPSISPGWAWGALPLRSRYGASVILKLLTFGLFQIHPASSCEVFQIVLRSPTPCL